MNPDLKAFVLSILFGALLLMLWDVLHGIRTAEAHGTFSNIVLDCIWWIFTVCCIVLYTWNTNSMKLRAFVFIGLFGGAFLYHITLSRAMRSLFCGVFDIIFKIFRFIFKILLTPAVFLYKILLEPIRKLSHRILKRGGRQ